MKKFVKYLMFILLAVVLCNVNISATSTLTPLKRTSGSGNVTYRGSNVEVLIPTEYTKPTSEFRGVWVSPLVNDIGSYIDEESYKNELLSVLEVMEDYKMNAIIFHLRIMNDALYDTDLSPKSSYISSLDFDDWDYLEWFINECHSRGIEFHAWLNPYRIANSKLSVSEVVGRYANYPKNPASKSENILIGTSGVILNPGEPEVRDFLVDTCMEIIEKYDVDAIHFDDYFYISMDGNADIATYNKYKGSSSTTNISDWRREQINIFIEDLSDEMMRYNKAHNRYVQLGISPSGIWRNGDGKVTYNSDGTAITNGSNTAGMEHYAGYLFSDTKKWIDEEWIDYIIPQSYWSFEHPTAGYADVVDWWAKVVKNKDVNLYTGMGIYMEQYSWKSNPYEASNQVLYNTKYPEIKGTAIFSFKELKSHRNDAGVIKIIDEYWTESSPLPALTRYTQVTPTKLDSASVIKDKNGYSLYFEVDDNVKSYIIYRSEGNIDVNDQSQIVGIVGRKIEDIAIFSDVVDNTKTYNYGILPLSQTNTRGEELIVNTKDTSQQVDFPIGELGSVKVSDAVVSGKTFQISFAKTDAYIGEEFTYTLRYSYDNINWESVAENKLRKSGNNFIYQMPLPEGYGVVYVKVLAVNSIGQVESETNKIVVTITGLEDYYYNVLNMLNYKIDALYK